MFDETENFSKKYFVILDSFNAIEAYLVFNLLFLIAILLFNADFEDFLTYFYILVLFITFELVQLKLKRKFVAFWGQKELGLDFRLIGVG